jgi:hypothetical protein
VRLGEAAAHEGLSGRRIFSPKAMWRRSPLRKASRDRGRAPLDPRAPQRGRGGAGGLYLSCDELLAAEAVDLLEEVRAYPPVKTARHRDGPGVFRTAEEALRGSARQAERRR